MCQCTPEIKTPFCGRGSCQWPTNPKKRYDPLNDPREIRKLLTNVAYTGERIDNGKQANRLSMASGLVRTVRDMAQHAGLSGEDHMTMLAYHALLEYEKTMDMMLDQAMLSPGPSMLFAGMSAHASTGGIVRVCPTKDIECGIHSQNWCRECPNRKPTQEGA